MNQIKDRRWWVFFGGVIMIFLVNIDATITNLALAVIAKDLHTDITQIQWIINSYVLMGAIFFIVGGKLSDIFGVKWVFLSGVLLFGAASLLAGTTSQFSVLIIARLIQGMGFAFALSLSLLMITGVFPENQRGFIVGMCVTITGLGQALGPTVGGAILQEFHWHWIFLINVPFAIVSFLVILFCFHGKRSQKRGTLDFVGILFLAIGLSSLLYAFNFLKYSDFNLDRFLVFALVGLLFLVIFSWKEIKTKSHPLFDFKLLKNRNYSLSLLIRFFYMYIYATFLFLIPLYMQSILGYSPLVAGLMLLIYSAIFGIASPMAGLLCDGVGFKPPIIFAALFAIVCFSLFALLGVSSQLYLIIAALICFGLSAGVMIPSTVNSTMTSLPPAQAGEGLGMFFTIAFLGTSLGVAVSGTQMALVSSHHLAAVGQHAMSLLNSQGQQILSRVAHGTSPVSALKNFLGAGSYHEVISVAQASFSKGLSSVMWTDAVMAVFIFIFSLILRRKPKNA